MLELNSHRKSNKETIEEITKIDRPYGLARFCIKIYYTSGREHIMSFAKKEDREIAYTRLKA